MAGAILALYGDELEWREESENRLGAQLLALLAGRGQMEVVDPGRALLVGIGHAGLLVTLLTTPVLPGRGDAADRARRAQDRQCRGPSSRTRRCSRTLNSFKRNMDC